MPVHTRAVIGPDVFGAAIRTLRGLLATAGPVWFLSPRNKPSRQSVCHIHWIVVAQTRALSVLFSAVNSHTVYIPIP